jgi:hypothetical protein
MSTRSTLRGFFSTGLRPTQLQFADLIDSSVSLVDSNNGTITLTGGVVVGNTGVPAVPGAIRWNGVSFEFHNGSGFQPLLFGSVVLSNPQDIGNVRIGSTLTGAMAAFSHVSRYNDNDVAFGQTPAGTTIVSSGTSVQIQNRTGSVATTVISVNNNRVVVGTPSGPAIPAGTTLAVYGEAQKSNGAAWTVMSDVRTKKDINEFSEGLDKLMEVNPVRFKYKNTNGLPNADAEQVGILAHEIKPVFPYMINEVKGKVSEEDTEETDLLTFNSSALQFVMINAIKELNNRLQSIEQSLTQSTN